MQWAIDLVALAGAAAIVAGVAMIYIPAAFIVGGAMALTGAILATLNARGTDSED